MASRGLGRLDDEDYPAVAMGQAAELLEVQPAFLRSLDAAGVVRPERSGGGHRRYSRRQLERAARVRALFDEGMDLGAAARIVDLEDRLDAALALIAVLERGGPADACAPPGRRRGRYPDTTGARRRGGRRARWTGSGSGARGQASIVRCCSGWCSTVILRGLARSATGIRSVRTPAS